MHTVKSHTGDRWQIVTPN